MLEKIKFFVSVTKAGIDYVRSVFELIEYVVEGWPTWSFKKDPDKKIT